MLLLWLLSLPHIPILQLISASGLLLFKILHYYLGPITQIGYRIDFYLPIQNLTVCRSDNATHNLLKNNFHYATFTL